ncbi:MAG: hypothetical protein QOI89_487 [Solirubrobacteraceae bacterium]|jgi:hypothetical protein|nr:hypothetical protein [Solirubrobacteraceae bacterium]
MRISPSHMQGTSSSEVALARWGAVHWRSLLAALVAALLCGAALYQAVGDGPAGVAPSARSRVLSRHGLSTLPLAAQAPVSATIGASSAVYRPRAVPDGRFRAVNPGQHLTSTFARSGVSVTAAAARLRLSTRAVGYGSALMALGSVAPRLQRGRIVYRRAGLTEWYANGPLGLEQGFTVGRAPADRVGGPLTLSIALTGNAHPSLSVDGKTIVLTRGGKAVLTYGGLSATGADGRLLHSSLGLSGSRLLLRVDTRGARYPLRIDPFVRQGVKITQTEGSVFGASAAVSADGNTALVGGGSAAWIFTRSGETWTQQGKELALAGGGVAVSVALSADGNTALIGTPSFNTSRGAAWVYVRSGETWTLQETFTDTGGSGLANFGDSVALSADGNTAVVGARRDHENVGGVWVFARSGEVWTQQGARLTSGTSEHNFGIAVGLSGDGNTTLIGSEGGVWVFTRSGASWSTTEKLALGMVSSIAISSDGMTALIGLGIKDSGKPPGASGDAVVFKRSGEAWVQQGGALPHLGQVSTETKYPGEFGFSVALSSDGNTALVGGPGDYRGIGAAWVYKRSGETWTQLGGKLVSADRGVGTRFGEGVALAGDGETAFVGQPGDGGGGAAWVYTPAPTREPPEFGKCVKTAYGAGSYSNSTCTVAETAKPYEWLAGIGPKHKFTLALTEGLVTFETTKGSKVVCTGEAGTGEYTGLKVVGGVELSLTGCERLGEKCTSSGALDGEVVTSPLEGILGVEKLGETAAKNKLGLDLFPVGHTGPFMKFNCGATEMTVQGSVILPLITGKTALTFKLKFTATKGKQKPEKFVTGEKDVLEASFNGGAFEQLGLTTRVTQVNEETIESNPAV